MADRRRHHGFTLIEAILSIVLIGIVTISVGNLMVTGLSSYSLITDRREALQEARLAVNMMTNELAYIVNPATGITAISSPSITFTPATGGSVTYSVTGGNLLRGTQTLAKNVTSNTGFAFYTAGGGTTANPAQVYRIHIAVEVDTGVAAHGKVMINSNVYLRNRYYNGYSKL